MRCLACGEDNPGRAKFCLECGAALEQSAASQALEERKVVTVLFCDLVGFTASSEAADPEDVRAVLEPYHRLVRRELEGYGGTVEKFIGDAVMAVFGAPVAHEDDAERAIRAALRLLEETQAQRSSGLALDVRIGINTGETVVALGARPEHGEALVAGDVVNTASRIQGVAPVNAIAVAEPTYRLTTDLFEFETLEPVQVKGKAEPLVLHRVLAARARFGTDMTTDVSTPFIGRQEDRSLLESTLRRAMRESSVQSVTIVGEPGVGKSRLVRELFTFMDELEELVSWRQGRCLPYGEGITFWALAEIVKAQAGVLESDEPEVAADKLRTAVGAVVEGDEEREWMAARLAPLVGLRREGTVEQQESFTAWTRFFEAIASTGPLVMVIEDLHWADEPLLGYLEHLVEYARDVPILLVTTARPELFERAPSWGGGRRNVQTLALSPLAQAETSLLVSALLEQSVLPAEVHALVLERSGGNPLYAEQFIRMLRDRGLLEERGRTLVLTSEEVPFPENVQALIAARLDTLDPPRKALLQDASAIGKIFWSAAVAEMSDRAEDEVIRDLHELVRKELIRASRVSSVRGTQEYAFWHVLLRDVAYGQVPRAARAAKHLSAASWIERIAADRVADHAEILAYHYAEALDLSRAAGQDAGAVELVERTTMYVTLAGERALSLDPRQAERHFRRAIDLTIQTGRSAAAVKVKLAEALQNAGEEHEAAALLEDAVTEAEDAGDVQLAGSALTRLSNVAWFTSGRDTAMEYARRAVDLLEGEPPSAALAQAYAQMTTNCAIAGDSAAAVEWADKALRLARDLSLRRETVRALTGRGMATSNAEGIGDLEEALRLALEDDLGSQAANVYNNLGFMQWVLTDVERALSTLEAGVRFAERRGLVGAVRTVQGSMMPALFDAGRWAELQQIADELEPVRPHDPQLDVVVGCSRAMVAEYRGIVQTDEVAVVIAKAREYGDPELLAEVLTVAASCLTSKGQHADALETLRELANLSRTEDVFFRTGWLGPIARSCVGLEATHLIGPMIDAAEAAVPRAIMMLAAARATMREATTSADRAIDDYVTAVDASRAYGSVVEEGHARLGLGRCLAKVATPEAEEHLVAARDVFSRLGAGRLVAEVDQWLAGSAQADASPA